MYLIISDYSNKSQHSARTLAYSLTKPGTIDRFLANADGERNANILFSKILDIFCDDYCERALPSHDQPSDLDSDYIVSLQRYLNLLKQTFEKVFPRVCLLNAVPLNAFQDLLECVALERNKTDDNLMRIINLRGPINQSLLTSRHNNLNGYFLQKLILISSAAGLYSIDENTLVQPLGSTEIKDGGFFDLIGTIIQK